MFSPDNIDAVRVALQRSPNKSTRKAAAQLEISRRLMHQRLKNDLNKYPYKMTMLPKLTAQNKDKKMAFAARAQNNEVSFNNVLFSDEANFHLDGEVNKQTAILGVRESMCDSWEGESCT
jgi:hypothetical protein